jgi:hypothetical protein
VSKHGLALAALEAGVWVEYNDVQDAWYYDLPHSTVTAWGNTPMDALTEVAVFLGLTPIPLYTAEQVEEAVKDAVRGVDLFEATPDDLYDAIIDHLTGRDAT